MTREVLLVAKVLPEDGNIQSLLPLPKEKEMNEIHKYKNGFHPLKRHSKKRVKP